MESITHLHPVASKAGHDEKNERMVGKKSKSVQFSSSSEELWFHSANPISNHKPADSEFDVQNRVSHKIRRITPLRNHACEQVMVQNIEQSKVMSVPTKTLDGIFQHRSGLMEPIPETRSLPYPEFWWCQPSKTLSLDTLELNIRPIAQVQGRGLC
jgi:hypothetical protein